VVRRGTGRAYHGAGARLFVRIKDGLVLAGGCQRQVRKGERDVNPSPWNASLGVFSAAFAAVVLAACSGSGGTPQLGGQLPAAANGGIVGLERHTAPPTATPTPSSSATPAFNDWPTYGYDNARDGYNPNTGALSPGALAGLHLAWATQLNDFNTQTQPIFATNVGSRAGTLIVGGGSGSAYGVDALTGSQLWRTPLGTVTFDCGGTYYAGVGGSAVYDPSSAAFFIVSTTNGSLDGPTHVLVNKLDAASGRLLGSVDVAPSPLAGEINFGHTSLLLDRGTIYAGTGSTCDISSWRGRVAAVHERSLTLAATFFTVYGSGSNPAPYSGGGVWGWGGVAADANGNVYAGVGNADTNGGTSGPQAPFVQTSDETVGYGDHVVELASGLSGLRASSLGAATYGGNSVDLDLSGTPSLAQPVGCATVLTVGRKSGDLYVYNAANIAAGPIATRQFGPSNYGSFNFANTAFSPQTGLIYAPVPYGMEPATSGPGLVAMSACNGNVNQVWDTAFGPDSGVAGAPRSMPTVTAGGVVLLGTPCQRDSTGGCTGTGAFGGAMWALDASSGALLNGGKPILTTPAQIRMGAVADADWLYVLDDAGDLDGLTIDSHFAAVANRFVKPLHSQQRMIRRR